MKLRDLKAKFVRYESMMAGPDHGRTNSDGSIQWGGFDVDGFVRVKSLAEAHGIRFLCPKNFVKNGGRAGTHWIIIVFEESPVPPYIGLGSSGTPQRWKASGTGLDDLTLSPSIQEIDDGLCGWHGFVENGIIRDA